MTEGPWHELLQVSEEDFDKIEPLALRSYPVYCCLRKDGQWDLWPKPLNDKIQLAWRYKG